MKTYRTQLPLALCTLLLLSCTSESDIENTNLELMRPDTDRQIQALEPDTEWRVDVRINLGAVQTFYFTNLETSPVVSVTGVRVNETNDISIAWFELLHGYEVEISYQPTQRFFAGGNTTAVADHTHTQFDYDQDGSSNYDERVAGTCVWSSGETCLDPSQIDIPTDNILINGNFSQGTDYWWSTSGRQEIINGEFCTFPPDYSGSNSTAILGFKKPLYLEANSRYTIEFYVQAQTNADISLSMVVPELERRLIYKSDIEVTTSPERIVRSFEYRNDSQNGVSFGLGTVSSPDNMFCFDDVKLSREPL